jgi:hypothetical protein
MDGLLGYVSGEEEDGGSQAGSAPKAAKPVRLVDVTISACLHEFGNTKERGMVAIS